MGKGGVSVILWPFFLSIAQQPIRLKVCCFSPFFFLKYHHCVCEKTLLPRSNSLFSNPSLHIVFWGLFWRTLEKPSF